MAQYKVGTVDVTNGSEVVTGNSTSFLATVSVGDAFTVTGTGFFYDVASVDSNTQITLSVPYQGVTETTTYTIARDFTPLNNIVELKQGDIETGAIFTRAMRKIDQQLSLNQDAGALTSAGVYSSTSAGISGTTSGDYFFVPEGDEFVLYLNSGGSAVEQVRFASLATALQYATDAQNAASAAAADATAASTDADEADAAAIEAEGFSQAAEGSATSAEDSATASADSAAASAQSATDASDDADRAEAARDAAEFNGGIYPDTTEGLLNTVDGNYFSTPNADADVYLDLYRNDAGSATLIASYPSKAFLEAVEARVTANEGDIGTNTGDITALEKVNTREELLREATLTADFANNRYEVYEGITDGLTERPLNDVFDFTRSSKAMGRTATKGLQEAIANAHRLVGNREGLLIEEERTNLLSYPRQFNQSFWDLTNITANSHSILSPDGELNGTLLTSTDSGTSRIDQNVSLSNGNDHTISGIVKYNNHQWLRVLCTGLVDNAVSYFDLLNGVAGTSLANSTSIESIGNGWYRYSVTATADASSGVFFPFQFVDSDNTSGFTGGTGQKGYIWHAQLEEGSFPTSVIPPATTFTSRSSTATYLDSTGTLQTASVDEARDDAYWYDSNGVLRPIGLLLEDVATNDIEESNDFSAGTGYWTDTESKFVATATSIFSGETAYEFASNSSSARLETPSLGSFDGNPASFSVIVESSSTAAKTWLYIRNSTANSFETVVEFSWTTREPAFDAGNQGGGLRVSATPWGQGPNGGDLYRVTVVYEGNSGDSFECWTYVDRNETGDSVFYHHAQHEAGSSATSPIVTAGTTVTRAADVSSSPAATRAADDCARTLGQEFNRNECTIYAEATSDNFVFLVTDATETRYLIYNSGGDWRSFDGDNVTPPGLTILSGQVNKVAIAIAPTTIQLSANGFSQSSQSHNGSFLTLDALRVGARNNGLASNTLIKDFRLYPRALTAQELAILTGGN